MFEFDFSVIHLFLLSVVSFQRIEEFRKSYDKAIADLENLHRLLLDNRTVRASESEPALKSCRQLNQDVQKSLLLVMDGGECAAKNLLCSSFLAFFRVCDILEVSALVGDDGDDDEDGRLGPIKGFVEFYLFIVIRLLLASGRFSRMQTVDDVVWGQGQAKLLSMTFFIFSFYCWACLLYLVMWGLLL